MSSMLLRSSQLITCNLTVGLASWVAVCLAVLLPSDWTLSRAFTKQVAVPAALLALCGMLLATHRYEVLLVRMNRLARSVDGGRGLDRNLVFVAPQLRDAYDDWSKTCTEQRAVEWTSILGHLAFHLRLMRKPTCTISHHFLATITWSQQLWTATMRHKLTVRGRSVANSALIFWLFTVHTLLLAAGDRCVSNDRASVHGSITSAASVSAIFLFIVYTPNHISMAHSPFALTYGVIACTAVGYLQYLPPSLIGSALLTHELDLDAADPGRWGLLATLLASFISAQMAFICHTLIMEIQLRSFLSTMRRGD